MVWLCNVPSPFVILISFFKVKTGRTPTPSAFGNSLEALPLTLINDAS